MRTISKTCAVLALGAVMANPADAQSYKEVEVSDGGAISGKVLAGAAKAEAQTFTITKDPDVCGTGARTVEWVRVNGDALLDVVVYIEEIDAGKPFAAEAVQGTVDQTGCLYTPYLSVMANGGELSVVNSDGVLHNVHTYELIKKVRRTVVNVSQPEGSDPVVKTIKLRRGVAMKVECDVHDFMHAWVFAAQNPYYAVADENGEFTITDVPPGTYVVKSWHGRLGEQETTIEVKAGETAAAEFTY
ncbi:MAG: hypothetical protein ACE5Q3_12145 [Alphaproteobacteria bacterium]